MTATAELTAAHCVTRVRHLVVDPIIIRPVKDGPEFVVRPCTRKHREMTLSGWLVLSCTKCTPTRLEEEMT